MVLPLHSPQLTRRYQRIPWLIKLSFIYFLLSTFHLINHTRTASFIILTRFFQGLCIHGKMCWSEREKEKRLLFVMVNRFQSSLVVALRFFHNKTQHTLTLFTTIVDMNTWNEDKLLFDLWAHMVYRAFPKWTRLRLNLPPNSLAPIPSHPSHRNWFRFGFQNDSFRVWICKRVCECVLLYMVLIIFLCVCVSVWLSDLGWVFSSGQQIICTYISFSVTNSAWIASTAAVFACLKIGAVSIVWLEMG